MSNEELQGIHQRLDRLEEKLDHIAACVTRRDAVCGVARGRLDALNDTIYGNGRDGLVTRVARIETMRRMWAAAASAILGLLSGIALTVLAWLLGK